MAAIRLGRYTNGTSQNSSMSHENGACSAFKSSPTISLARLRCLRSLVMDTLKDLNHLRKFKTYFNYYCYLCIKLLLLLLLLLYIFIVIVVTSNIYYYVFSQCFSPSQYSQFCPWNSKVSLHCQGMIHWYD